ncbi:MAG: hypothetical protein E7047_05635, partial [Lentisphaerae bacterium]|nr:hypothetical protein [Lentisphaerota bacterium]
MDKFNYKDIALVWQNNVLTVSNSQLTRRIDFSQGLPQTQELIIDQISVAGKNPGFDFQLIGFPLPGTERLRTNYQTTGIEFAELNRPDGDGAAVTVKVFESVRELQLAFRYIVYCNMPVMALETFIQSAVTPMLYWNPRQKHETFHYSDANHSCHTICDSLALNKFAVNKSVEFQMRTDYFDEPILEHAFTGDQDIYGNILIAENDCQQQFFFLQEAPPSSERRGDEPGDFLVDDPVVSSLGSGITAGDITPG